MSAFNWYRLDPIDLLLMRESKPFSPGDGSWARGQFPPLPITVFQAMRSATPWQGDKSDRQSRDLNFIGPFLLYAPPGESPTLWLPTPQDLICVTSRTWSNDDPDNTEDFTETATAWERTARFQPLDSTNPAWKHIGLDPDFFSEGELAPMVPPMYLENPNGESLNTYLRQPDENTREAISGRPKPWIRADALVRYLKGEVLEADQLTNNSPKADDYFHADPWDTQVLPHIKVQSGTRQVKEEEGYFTEVAIRMRPHWYLVAGISAVLDAKVVRLGGEGHRAIVEPMPAPPHWEDLQAFFTPKGHDVIAYALTPGLAEVSEDYFGLIPKAWKPALRSCVSDRPLLGGGMSVFQKTGSSDKSAAFQPQRAFVPPGTVYRFQSEQLSVVLPTSPRLLPDEGGTWLATLNSLNYGTLLWGQ